GRPWRMAPTDATGPSSGLRMTISAATPAHQWARRGDGREHMLRWVVEQYPHCIPRMRVNSFQAVMDVRNGSFPEQEAEAHEIDPSEVRMLLSEGPFQQRRPGPES